MSSESQFLKSMRLWDHSQRNWSLKRKHMTFSLHTGGNSSVSTYVCQDLDKDTEDSPDPEAHGTGPKSYHFEFISIDSLILSINPPKQWF